MRINFILLIFLATVLFSCRQDNRNTAIPNTAIVKTNGNNSITTSGIQYSIIEILQCRYPDKDPVFKNKQGKKLLLFRLEIYCRDKVTTAFEIPQGALLTDSRGNSYESLPGVIAMAQTNDCIKGDDIKAYNIIWAGEMKAGDKQTAYVLGFEVPEDASPEKLYWNNKWKDRNIFFLFH